MARTVAASLETEKPIRDLLALYFQLFKNGSGHDIMEKQKHQS